MDDLKWDHLESGHLESDHLKADHPKLDHTKSDHLFDYKRFLRASKSVQSVSKNRGYNRNRELNQFVSVKNGLGGGNPPQWITGDKLGSNKFQGPPGNDNSITTPSLNLTCIDPRMYDEDLASLYELKEFICLKN